MNKHILGIVFSVLSTSAIADIEADAFDVPTLETSSLYIKSEKDIDNLETVTYFISNTAIERPIIDSFFFFSEEVGSKNGAIILSVESKNKKHIKQKSHKEMPNTFSITSKSTCDFSLFSNDDRIIFEDRTSSECFYFKINSDNSWLIQTLNTIYKNTNNTKNTIDIEKIKTFELENLIFKDVETKSEYIDNNINEVRILTTWIAKKLKELFKQSQSG